MKYKARYLTTISTLFVVTAVAVSAGTPCGKPVVATFDPGGACIDPWYAGAYCTQAKVLTQGKCEGANQEFVCATGSRQKVFPFYVLGTPNNGCAGGCVASPGQTVQVNYTEAFTSTAKCVIVVEPGAGD